MKTLSLDLAVVIASMNLKNSFSPYQVVLFVRQKVNDKEWSIDGLPDLALNGKTTMQWIDLGDVMSSLEKLLSLGLLTFQAKNDKCQYSFKMPSWTPQVTQANADFLKAIDEIERDFKRTEKQFVTDSWKNKQINCPPLTVGGLNAVKPDKIKEDAFDKYTKDFFGATPVQDEPIKVDGIITSKGIVSFPPVEKIDKYIENQLEIYNSVPLYMVQSRFKGWKVKCSEYLEYFKKFPEKYQINRHMNQLSNWEISFFEKDLD